MTVDNGSQFNSKEFKLYLKQHNIEHRRVTPYWPIANGEVERFNRTVGKAIQTAHAEGKDWKKELQNFLLQYRTTPHCITGVPPTAVLFNYDIKNGIPSVNKHRQSKIDQITNKQDNKRKKISRNMQTFKEKQSI